MKNPINLLAAPALLFFSIPLAFFAVTTTTVALSLLLFRVSIVYFELGLALLHSWIFASTPLSTITTPRSPKSPRSPPSSRSSPTRHRRRSSALSTASSASEQKANQNRVVKKSESFASLLGPSDLARDYEGVGGWRLSSQNDDEESIWLKMNSRLELPANSVSHSPTASTKSVLGTPGPQAHGRKHHQRSLTGGSQRWSWSPEAIRMSPVQSRARTPNATLEYLNSGEGYFEFQANQDGVPEMGGASKSSQQEPRRKSLGGSSSTSSSGVSKKGGKHVGKE